MPRHRREQIWTVDNQQTDLTCNMCHEALTPGQQAVTCPRCRAVHHLSCWCDKGGCATYGCRQLADPELLSSKPRTYDPPARDTMAWLPLALAGLILVLAVGGMLWARWNYQQPGARPLTLLMPADAHLALIEQVAREYDNERSDLKVSVISVPIDDSNLYYEQKLLIMLAGRDAPDLVVLPYDRLRMYAEHGGLASLSALKEKAARAVSYGARLDNGVINGELFGIPHPSQPGFFAVPAQAPNADTATELILRLIERLPFVPGIDDRQASETEPAPTTAPTTSEGGSQGKPAGK